jgi:hypothetical protein
MSSTPTLEARPAVEADEWIDIAPPRDEPRFTGANILVAISQIRGAVSRGDDEGIVIDTDKFREIDDLDVDAAAHAAQRWSE